MKHILTIVLACLVTGLAYSQDDDGYRYPERACDEWLDETPDNPRIRNAVIIDDSNAKTIRILVHSFSRPGTDPSCTVAELEEGLVNVNGIFAPANIQFIAEYIDHYDTGVLDCSGYGQTTCEQEYLCKWYNGAGCYADRDNVGNTFAQNIDTHLNVFVANLYSAGGGYPWYHSTDAKKSVFIVSTNPVNPLTDDNVLAHEFGHRFGLYHVYQGQEGTTSDPAVPCDDCWESPDLPNATHCVQFNEADCLLEYGCYWDDNHELPSEYYCGPLGDIVGDFCTDTAGIYRYGGNHCNDFSGNDDCNGSPFETTPTENLMTQHLHCRNYLTEQQIQRMHGWIEHDYNTGPGVDTYMLNWVATAIFTNRDNSTGIGNLGGTLTIENVDTGIIEQVDSDQETPLYISALDHYDITTLSQSLNDGIEDLYHIKWEDRADYKLTVEDFVIGSLDEVSAHFDSKYGVTIETEITNGTVKIRDPWYETGGQQPNELQDLTSSDYGVFLNQGGMDINNLQPPYYGVYAQPYYRDDDHMYRLTHFDVNNSQYAEVATTTDELGGYPVVFRDENASVTAMYAVGASGDVNDDGVLNVLDVVRTVNIIVGQGPPPTQDELDAADVNGDTYVNVLDVIIMQNYILEGEPLPRTMVLDGYANLHMRYSQGLSRSTAGSVTIAIENNTPLRGIQFDIAFDHTLVDFSAIEFSQTVEPFEKEFNTVEDGLVRVVLYSNDHSNISEGYNEIAVVEFDDLSRNNMTVEISVVNPIIGDVMGRDVFNELNETNIPEHYLLHPAYPNPFNPETTIQFELPDDAIASLRIYDSMGKEVVNLINGFVSLGYHEVKWDATGFSSGIYFVVLETPYHREQQKVVLLK